MFALFVGLALSSVSLAAPHTTKQQSLDEWRRLTAENALPPKVYIKGNIIQFYFHSENGVDLFQGDWDRVRVPSEKYKVGSALIRWQKTLPVLPKITEHAWREAVVVSGMELRRLTTNLFAALAPTVPGSAAYYQAFLGDGVLYRDAQGKPHFKAYGEQPPDVRIERQYSVEETLELLAHAIEQHLALEHPGQNLFLIMSPSASRIIRPLLLDRLRHRCLIISPAALFEQGEFGLTPALGFETLEATLLEGHGLALLKNPVSSAVRLADIAVQTVIRFVRLRLPKLRSQISDLNDAPGMELDKWEKWLDKYTGTRQEEGSLRLLIDGERFFTRFTQSLAEATNHIHLEAYIFDKDDVAVQVADQLKRCSKQVEVKLLVDRLGTIGGGASPPATPLPEDFTPPRSITSYLKQESNIKVRSFLNPWFSSDHSKLLIVDGIRAWLGGMNIGREYRYEWHDLMVEVEGPVLASFEKDFRRHWAHAGLLGDLSYLSAVLTEPSVAAPPVSSGDWMKIRRLPTRTAWKPFATAVRGAMRKAQNHVYAENAYLFDARTIVALVDARARGADVRVVLPRVNDIKAGGRGNLIIANYLLEHGVRVYFYPGMTHVKALLVDGWTCLGSGNLNHLSLRVNQEQNIATSDPVFADKVRQDLFEEDFARSYELSEPISVEWVDFVTDLLLEGF